jgi:hypothetical protein
MDVHGRGGVRKNARTTTVRPSCPTPSSLRQGWRSHLLSPCFPLMDHQSRPALPPFTPPTTRETESAHVLRSTQPAVRPRVSSGHTPSPQHLYDPGVCLGGRPPRSEARQVRGLCSEWSSGERPPYRSADLARRAPGQCNSELGSPGIRRRHHSGITTAPTMATMARNSRTEDLTRRRCDEPVWPSRPDRVGPERVTAIGGLGCGGWMKQRLRDRSRGPAVLRKTASTARAAWLPNLRSAAARGRSKSES